MPLRLQPGMRVHILGIGGFGMSAIAHVMHNMGYTVTGCDMQESALIAPLRKLGIAVDIGHSEGHLDQHAPDALIISSAIPRDLLELQVAETRDIPIVKRDDLLGTLMSGRKGVAVAGTHGKTTTTAMISHVLTEAGLEPTYIIGGVSANLGSNAGVGKGEPFVVEADEYDRMFLGLQPSIIVLTSLEHDHPDQFKDLQALRDLFSEFVDLLPPDGVFIANASDPEVRPLIERVEAAGRRVVTYGLESIGNWTTITGMITHDQDGQQLFRVFQHVPVSETTGMTGSYNARLIVPGVHNVMNAMASLIVAVELGVDPTTALGALATFSGVGRRFEVKGEAGGVTVIDDYAHHPTAIAATLEAARERYGSRPIWAVWQPHTYSRTHALLGAFTQCFSRADHVIITDVYRSRDRETFGVTPASVLEGMTAPADAQHVGGGPSEIASYLAEHVKDGDVVVVMSAGDATQVGDQLLQLLST